MSAERDALLMWSMLAEASDEAAAWLVMALGPEDALAWVDMAVGDPVAATARLAPHAPPGTVDKAIHAAPRWALRRPHSRLDDLRRRTSACGARVMTRLDEGWPGAFADWEQHEPFALWVRGTADLDAAWAGGVAMVGSRSATSYGEHVTADLAGALADGDAMRGVPPRAVISGGAYGIDARAHRAALAVGGVSIAVLAGGIDRLYPAGNGDLLERLTHDGAIVSEAPPGQAPYRARFLSRNRLIAAASVTVVVEAAVRSGALSTARHAMAINRPVAAVPGPVTSMVSGGCHRLIREQEAVLVSDADDVRELAAPIGATARPEGREDRGAVDFAHPHDRAAYDAVGGRGGDAGVVAGRAGLTVEEALTSLGRLELSGVVQRVGGGWRRVAPKGA